MARRLPLTILRVLGLAAGAALMAGLGCGGAPPSTGAAEDPAAHVDASGRGRLVARVAGNPRDIRYFIDGKHVDPGYEIEWWRDARFEVELEPGSYDVEAEYLVRAFAGEGETYRIVASEPVVVRPGRVTLLYARIDKDYRGVPQRKTEVFSILNPSRSSDTEDEPAPEPRGASRTEDTVTRAGAQAATEVLRVRQNEVRIEAAASWASTSISSNGIQVRGARVSLHAAPPAPSVRAQESTTITIRRQDVSQTPGGLQVAEDAARGRWRIRGDDVESGAVEHARRAVPQRGDAIRIRGTQVSQEAAPATSPRQDAAPEAIRIRGSRVTVRPAPAADRPPPDAPVQSIRIQSMQVEVGTPNR